MTDWVKPEHSKGKIDRAGDALAEWWIDPDELDAERDRLFREHFRVVENWRVSHRMPLLTFRIGLAQRSRRIDSKVIVAQRLKRFSSVMNKLGREGKMKLSRMHDLGGCRAIVSGIPQVYELFNSYRHGRAVKSDSGRYRFYDYIKEPKDDGYRGIHVVGRYVARKAKNEPWNGHRIEVQLRTRLQHAFATAVETVTTFTREPLKFGAGSKPWRRFFKLMGSAIAMRERTPLVEDTPSDPMELRKELRRLTKELRVKERLRGWANALKTMPRRHPKSAKSLLLVLDLEENTIEVTGFADHAKATEEAARLETSQRRDVLDVVVVWVSDIRDLRSAYPNYYADTRVFIRALDAVLASPQLALF